MYGGWENTCNLKDTQALDEKSSLTLKNVAKNFITDLY